MAPEIFKSTFPSYFLNASPLVQAIIIGRLKMLKWSFQDNALIHLAQEFIKITSQKPADLDFTIKDYDKAVSEIEKIFNVKYITTKAQIPNNIILIYIQAVQCHPKMDLIHDQFFPGGRKFASDLQISIEHFVVKWTLCSPKYIFSEGQLENELGIYVHSESVRLYRTILNHFSPIKEWSEILSLNKRALLINYLSLKSCNLKEVDYSLIEAIEQLHQGHEESLGKLEGLYYLGQYYFHQGEFEKIKSLIPFQLDHHQELTQAALKWMEGDFQQSLDLFQKGIMNWPKIKNANFNPLNDLYGLIYTFAILVDSKISGLRELSNRYGSRNSSDLLNIRLYESLIYDIIKGDVDSSKLIIRKGDTYFVFLTIWLSKYFLPQFKDNDLAKSLVTLYSSYKKKSHWFRSELAFFLNKYTTTLNDATQELLFPLLPIPGNDFGQQEWEVGISRLEELNVQIETGQETRLIWIIDPINFEVFPLEQKRMKNGDWSKGRKIAPNSILNGTFKLSNPLDRMLTAFISSSYYGNTSYDYEETIAALVGRQEVYRLSKTLIPVKIVSAVPTLQLQLDQQSNYKLSINPALDGDITIVWPKFDLVEVYTYSPVHKKIHYLLSDMDLIFPPQSHSRLFKWLDGIKKDIHLSGDIPVELLNELSVIEGRSKVTVKIIPFQEASFRVETYVQPVEHLDYFFKVGIGHQNFTAEIDGSLVNIQRNLSLEIENLAQLNNIFTEVCNRGLFEEESFLFEDQIEMLTFIEHCQPLVEQDKAHIEVLRDHNNKILSFLKPQQLFLHLNASRGWLELEGEDIVINEGLAVKFSELLEFSRQDQTHFMAVGEGDFILISKKLKQLLKQIGSVAGWHKEEAIAHPLTALYLDSVISTGEARAKRSKKWTDQVTKLESIERSSIPLPDGLNATLRSYQVEGFEWLVKRGEQELGACLADDMGLGKTIQSIAVLLHRASLGPALIIAPTSVCANWVAEIEKFAPQLRTFNYYEEDRSSLVEKLKEGDVLICSYGLLTNDIDTLKKIQFSSAILDEAQAIKNPEAKRSKAVYQIQAKARWVTTGTPIENRLQELWSIFRFINPGLLGTLSQFRERFVTPIEGNNDKLVSNNLRLIIQPFLLRRTKEEVLKDLPPKTEVDRTIILSAAEMSFYEAIRRKAKEDLQSAQSLPSGQRQIKLFAILTQLRLASCHPALVQPEVVVSGSKIEALHELLDEILPGGHQVLVFSQFVKHLAIVKDSLDEKKIPYFYLDGSTSPKERKKCIQAFEAGKRPVFLLSLKAGGTGINLTAASYVIHMDPWWNPAVEDQATDRAHRIGQDKPVTVYRLISKNTIEEKIRTIHQTKRDLADQIIGDQATSSLQLSEVMELLIG
jgi:SNF2 family DNA or RNA helicase